MAAKARARSSALPDARYLGVGDFFKWDISQVRSSKIVAYALISQYSGIRMTAFSDRTFENIFCVLKGRAMGDVEKLVSHKLFVLLWPLRLEGMLRSAAGVLDSVVHGLHVWTN